MTSFNSLSVFFPAYNDALSLPGLVARTFAVLDGRIADFEVILVNDGSQDNTGEVIEQLRRQYGPRLRVVTHEVNRGYGGALRSGFQAATKEWVFYTDGDGQYDVAELTQLLDAVEPGIAWVNGYKRLRHDPWHRVLLGGLYNQTIRQLFQIKAKDVDCDFRLVRRDLVPGWPLISTSGAVCLELVYRLESTGCGLRELPVSHREREHGASQFFRWRSLATMLQQVSRLYYELILFPRSQARNAAKVPAVLNRDA
jgi:glycosyltransferase involved in cell wall biosynthesis